MSLSRLNSCVLIILLVSLIYPFASASVIQGQSSAVERDQIIDRDQSDSGFTPTLANLPSSEFEAIVHITDGTPLPNFLSGKEVNYQFSSIHAVSIDLTPSLLPVVLSLPFVEQVEQTPSIDAQLLDSTAQLGVQTSFWNSGVIGSNQTSIAVIDTGIDPTHPAFNDRLIASYNAINDNDTFAEDTNGHGTHVAGIALGNYNNKNGLIEETARGVVPSASSETSYLLSLAFQLENIKSGQSVDIVFDWGNVGPDSPGSEVGFVILDPNTRELACSTCEVTSTTGYIDTTLELNAGSYYVGVLNEGGGEDQNYEIGISYTKEGIDDGSYPSSAGVAYGTNLVAVKALEGLEGGDLKDFDKAVNWVINNRIIYNITVVNLSLGLNQTSAAMNSMMAKLADNGILPVVAAGNSGSQSGGVYSPGSAPEALTVGSVNNIGEVTFYTNVGSRAVNGEYMKPDVLAPGGSVASPALGFQTGYELGFGLIEAPDGNNIGFDLMGDDLIGYQGTSMASPHIAGLASLLSSDQINEWDWNSRSTVMEIKRKILAGSYEVANIGYGREQPPETSFTGPELNRDMKDFHEGWGAVDARAVAGLDGEEISLGFNTELSVSLSNPKGQKSYGWPMTLQAGLNYGFIVDAVQGADFDIKIINADTGPLHDGKDYGELEVLASTSSELGESEGLGFHSEATQDIYVIVTIVEGDGDFSTTFAVDEVSELPTVEILSPFEGQTLENPVTIEFSSSATEVDLYLDGTFIDTIESGYSLQDLLIGNHTVRLVAFASDSIIKISDRVTFEVVEEDTIDSFLDTNQPLFYLSIIMLVIFNLRSSRKFQG